MEKDWTAMTWQGPASGCRDLDLSAERAWPPARVEILDGWRCRLDRGVTRRANSVLAADWTGKDLPQGFSKAENIYEKAGLTPCFQITPAAQPLELDEALAARGYGANGHSLVQRADLLCRSDTTASLPDTAASNPDVRLTARAGAAWCAALQAGGPREQGLAKCQILERIELPCAFVACGPEAAPDAIGLGICDGEVVWLNSMYSRPEARGRGLARRLLTAIACWAAKQGAEALMLQVEADNVPARRLYEGFGFSTLYPYHYRSKAMQRTDKC
jgi:GNAT superfamily N-acetyltransferase